MRDNDFHEICLETVQVTDMNAVQDYIIDNLEPCAEYRIRISAVTPLGQYSIDVRHVERTNNEGNTLMLPYSINFKHCLK